MNRLCPPRLSVLLVLAILAAPATGAPAPVVAFTHGVASGDVTPVSAILWTRVSTEARLTLEVSPDRSFQRIAERRTVLAPASDDFTVKVAVFPLLPNTTYFYRSASAARRTAEHRTPGTTDGEQRHETRGAADDRRVGCKPLILIEASPSAYRTGRLVALRTETGGSLYAILHATTSVLLRH
jgi:phosphodiesterase/alkaline phosphatase D-like protein